MDELAKVLNKEERVLWKGKPVFAPYVLGTSIPFVLFGIIWLGMLFFASAIMILFLPMIVCLIPFYAIGLGMVFGIPAYAILVYKNIIYAITDKRVIIQSGLVGRDFKMIEYDQITNAEVNVGIIDKLFNQNTGSINLLTADSVIATRDGVRRVPHSLSHIESPYEVFKHFKKVSFEIKTDVNYPNKLRPGENPGYKTRYRPQKSKKSKR